MCALPTGPSRVLMRERGVAPDGWVAPRRAARRAGGAVRAGGAAPKVLRSKAMSLDPSTLSMTEIIRLHGLPPVAFDRHANDAQTVATEADDQGLAPHVQV